MVHTQWQSRVIEEKDALYLKLGALELFLSGGRLERVPIEEQKRLRRQREAMNEYLTVLQERIDAFEDYTRHPQEP